MARPMVLGCVVVVIAVLMLSSSGPTAPAANGASAATGLLPSVAPAATAAPNPFSTGMAANVVLGAPNLTTDWDGTTLNASAFIPGPELSCMSPAGDLFSPDFGGSRILEFQPPFHTAESASLVIGQASFATSGSNTTATTLTHPAACTFDSAGDLWVSDFYNNRVLEFRPPFTDGMAASLVLGQTSFNQSLSGVTASNFSAPLGLALDAQGDLWVADAGNDRVLEFVPPFSTGMSASLVLGQSDFTDDAGALTASGLAYPADIAFTSGVLWVADADNDRVVGFSAPFSTGEGETYLLGQTSFIGSGASGPGAFVSPYTISSDGRGDLWVSDTFGDRAVEFRPPFTNFENPSVALGQSTLTGTGPGDSATTLDMPFGVFVAPNGAIFVDDNGNNRVLEYIPANYSLRFSATGIPAMLNWSLTVDGATSAQAGPTAVVTEENGSYTWSVASVPGYMVSPSSGTVALNGTGVSVDLTITPVSYAVSFQATGLPAGTGWSVTLGGVTHTSPNNGTIAFAEANGSYPYSVGAVSGYNVTSGAGSVLLTGASKVVSVGFFATPTSEKSGSTSSPGSRMFGLLELIVLLLIAAVVGAVVALLATRRRRGG
ncbi:MAG: NHL repeat-containing protein, partial [Thermoplasmata archaeon]